jgi:hypothetical protein
MGATTPPPAQGSKSEPLSFLARMRRFFLRLFIFLIVAVPIGLALYLWAALTFSYSAGERVGYVQKFSKKGWICKTWEGELAMVNIPGSMAQIFTFTVRDSEVAAKINTTIGKRVVLHYEQHLGLPTSCFGDTSYFIKAVDPAEP